ncbi:glycosyltransferase [Mucilaginibacter celer]|uniref:Glycosyltransferase n=1 Tax=Mucilaginibacter celer TaxID=2305508 RepID=A0A494VJE2_9SPHI|nr:glycosyltransferase [Mucilaginibacter celer]AYL95127.1 glycosyltransferase [Mucilaginibacter celer]
MMNDNVLACIMAFYPGDQFEKNCKAIAEKVSFLLIVDNSPGSTLLNSTVSWPANTEIVYNKNEGAVAGALNIALKVARDRGFDYLQLFDQDTEPPLHVTSQLISALKANPHVVMISPRFTNMNTGHPGRVMMDISKWKIKSVWPRADEGLLNALFAINSASIINMNLLPKDLYYDERLIIDGCDVEFCLALKVKNHTILVDTSQCIIHGIGNRKNGGGRWSPTNYSAQRKYLGAKNRVIVWRRYFKNYPGFILNDLYVFFLDTARTVLLEKERFSKLGAILKGLFEGLKERDIATRKYR